MKRTNSLSRTASWVIVERSTGNAVLETFSEKIANLVDKKRFEAVPILQYLQSLNRRK